MIYVAGTRRVEKLLGYVADFCPICRTIRPFKISSVRAVEHLYYVPLGSGKLAGHTGTCDTCGTIYAVDVSLYGPPARDASGTIGSLESATFPRLREEHARRLDLENRIRSAPLEISASDRSVLIAEPFRLLTPRIESVFAGNNAVDLRTGLGCAGTIIVPILFVAAASMRRAGAASDWMSTAALITFCIGLAFTFTAHLIQPHHKMRAELLPLLAKCLFPLQPSPEEIAECLQLLKSQDYLIAKKLRPETVTKALASLQHDNAN